MEGFGVLIIVGFFALMAVLIGLVILKGIISRKVSNVTHRATQAALNSSGVPISNSNISNAFSNALSQKATGAFLSEHPNYNEETLKQTLFNYAVNLINATQIPQFAPKVIEKRMKDNKFAKMGNVTIKHAYLMNYSHGRFAATVVVSNGRDEYQIMLQGTTDQTGLGIIDNYSLNKGVAVGL